MPADSKRAYHSCVLQSSISSQPAVRYDGSFGIADELRGSSRRIRELERVRVELARTLLDVQQACETIRDPNHAQRLISAAVRDLEELDARLFEARTFDATAGGRQGLLAG